MLEIVLTRSKATVEAQKSTTEESHQLQPLKEGEGETPAVEVVEPKGVYQPRLGWALMKAFSPLFLAGAFFKLCHDILLFVSPVLLK